MISPNVLGFSAYQKQSDIVFGSIISSNLFNIFADLGIIRLISPIIIQSSTVWKEIPISLFAVLLLLFLSNSIISLDEVLSRLDGIILLLFFFLFQTMFSGKKKKLDRWETGA